MAFLPDAQRGYLPYFLLFVCTHIRCSHRFCYILTVLQESVSALIHTVVCFTAHPDISMAVFSGPRRPPPSGLLAHVYGVKNIYTGLIRAYAAYHIANPELYQLAMWSCAGVLFLYGLECFVYNTARLRECTWPFILAGSGTVWMIMQKEWYTA